MDFPDIKNIQDFAISLSRSNDVNLQQPSVSVLYNKYVGASKYITTIQNIFPLEGIDLNTRDTNSCEFIIDTDPLLLIRTIESILFNSQI